MYFLYKNQLRRVR